NAPYGACPECSGIGTRLEVDPDLVIPDPDLSLAEGAVAPWSSGSAEYYQRILTALSDDLDFSMHEPWSALPKAARKAILHGKDHKVHVRDRKSTRLNSSHVSTSYAVFCLNKKTPLS